MRIELGAYATRCRELGKGHSVGPPGQYAYGAMLNTFLEPDLVPRFGDGLAADLLARGRR